MRNPIDRVGRLVILKHLPFSVALEIALFHLFMDLEVGIVGDGMVIKRTAIGATVHDDRELALLGGAEHICIHIQAVLQRHLDVFETLDTQDVAANFIARSCRLA